jgi:hypothetical protein
MKIKIHLLLFLCAIPVAALREGGRQAIGDKAVTGIAFLLPQVDNDISDLDVRDAQNRRVQAPSAKQAIEDLFRENLLNLTVFATPHSVTTTNNWLILFSHLLNKAIYARLALVIGLFQEACLPSNRRFVHNVHNMWTTFFVGFFMSCLLLAARSPVAATHRLNLRC